MALIQSLQQLVQMAQTGNQFAMDIVWNDIKDTYGTELTPQVIQSIESAMSSGNRNSVLNAANSAISFYSDTGGVPGDGGGDIPEDRPDDGGGGGGGTPDEPADGGLDVTNIDYILAQEQMALQKYIAELNARTDEAIASANRAAQEAVAQANAELQRELQANEISHEQYMQKLDLAQREAEFTRDLELRTIIADRNHEIQQAQVRLGELAEERESRLLHAQLASDPANFVLYEFFKRGGSPEQFAQEQADQGVIPGTQEVYQDAFGGEFEPTQPAYTDDVLQGLVEGFLGTNKPLYNPNVAGTGAFGAEIPGANEISREAYAGMDATQRDILNSFLRAGVEVGGKRVGINPADYIADLERSFIPVAPGTARTQYI